MKKNYISPVMAVDDIELVNVLCLSIQPTTENEGYADPDQSVLTKELLDLQNNNATIEF